MRTSHGVDVTDDTANVIVMSDRGAPSRLRFRMRTQSGGAIGVDRAGV